ncbi:membrane anchor subunit of succinate dehydrogenase, Sdh4 [Basidiobolus ranarum]|uniref:Succinate dehydrogenase [ubiquinone] cytochrome b small subunit n=1 Tax=Basidiobolus ranarum TaxID=34480 RepID=A0ABR2WN33_9FUNG
MASRTLTTTALRISPLVVPTVRLGAIRTFQTGHVGLMKNTKPVQSEAVAKNVDGLTVHAVSRAHGSIHWNIERALSVSLLPLVLYPMVYGSQPIIDYSLGVILPAHCHIGFQACITDYLPHRKTPFLYNASTWALRAATALTLYGCYEVNTNGDGITATVKKLWKA